METPLTITADLNEILFEGRNKAYGAYQLRNKYSRHLSRAALVALLLFLTGTSIPKIVSWFIPLPEIVSNEKLLGTSITLLDVPVIEKPVEPPPTLETPPPPRLETIRFVVPIPDPNTPMDSSIAEQDTSNKQIDTAGRKGDPNGDIDWEHLEKPKIGGGGTGSFVDSTDLDIFRDLQEEPKAVNMKQFKEMVGYPQRAIEGGIEGRVSVRVQIDKYGNYIQHKVLKDPHPILTKAVEAQLKNLKFTPGIQAGKPVKTWITVPVDFVLH